MLLSVLRLAYKQKKVVWKYFQATFLLGSTRVKLVIAQAILRVMKNSLELQIL